MGAAIISLLLTLALAVAAGVFLYSGLNQYLLQSSRLSRRLKPESQTTNVIFAEEQLVPDGGVLESIERYVTPEDPERVSKIRRQLVLAGYRHPAAVRAFFMWKWGIALSGLFLASIVLASTMTRANPLTPIAAMSIVVLLSYFAADMWVQRKIAYRKLAIERAFPDALDLLLVCIEAGHGLDAAIHRVATEINTAAPELSEELSLIVAELRAGKMRDRVLKDFSERTGIDDVASFVTVIKQADQFGVSIADTLRVYSREMRNKRYMRAEEKANMMPIKLALGAIAFTVPPVILILIGPSVVLIIREMAKATSGVDF